MSIQYSGNVGIYSYSTGSSTPSTDMETALLTNLVTAGWTNTPTAATAVLTFTGKPANNSTFTLDNSPNAETYTFVTSLSSSNQILIGATQSTAIANAYAAMTGGAGSGSLYSSVFTPPPNFSTTTVPGTSLTFTYTTRGSAGNGAASTVSGTINATFASTTAGGGGNVLFSAVTPQGLGCAVSIHTTSGSFYNPGTKIVIVPQTLDGSLTGPDISLAVVPQSSTAFKLIASKYQFFNFTPGDTDIAHCGNGMGMGVPFLTTNLVAPTISAATNTTPIVCTIAAHGFTTGQSVLIIGGTGNTAINGTWTITVIDTNTFSLNTSVGNGTYVANSAFCSNLTIGNTVNQAIWAGAGGGGESNFRIGVSLTGTMWQTVNSQQVNSNGGTERPQFVYNITPNGGADGVVQWYDNSFVLLEPFLAWGISAGAAPKIIGQMWDAVLVRQAITIDQTATFDSPSHNFWTVGVDSTTLNSLLMATS